MDTNVNEMEKIDEKTSFQPCPICGARLTVEDLRAVDDEGEVMEIAGDIDTEDGSVYCRDACSGYIRDADATFCVMIRCTCGYCYCADGDDVGFPYKGWLDAFRAKADRRA